MDKELIKMEQELEKLEEKIEKRKYKLIYEKTGLKPGRIQIGEWGCNKSPIGICVYDMVNDVSCDCCIFCGEPDERK